MRKSALLGLVKMIHLKQLSLILLICFLTSLHSLPLSTKSRWIIDTKKGHRVKLKCVNWAGHMEVMVPEGLDRQPLDKISAKVASLGFNCVRLTWAIHMYTRSSQVQVGQSFESMKLFAARDGIQKYNPHLLNMTLVDAQAAVVDSLGKNDIMVVLDNHVSKPMWCCSDGDGNGFFGDQYFDTREWLQGWNLVATRYTGKKQVVGMSLRNELRGPHQNENIWHQNMQEAAAAIHKTYPETLVIVSGLSYDSTLQFLTNKSLHINVPDKLVYEIHRYSMTGGGREKWLNQPLNKVCGDLKTQFEKAAGFLVNSSEPFPLFVGEFGVDQTGGNEADNRFLSCFISVVAEKDMDWALWALQGSYYRRNGKTGFEETYGVLDADWSTTRDQFFKAHYGLLQTTLQDSESDSRMNYVIYHLKSGDCAQIRKGDLISIGDCSKRSIWVYDEKNGRIKLKGTSSCIKMAGDGPGVIVSSDCSDSSSSWSLLSNSKLHIGARMSSGAKQLCMEWNDTKSGATIVTKDCVCIDDSDAKCLTDPRSQWFQLIPTNVK